MRFSSIPEKKTWWQLDQCWVTAHRVKHYYYKRLYRRTNRREWVKWLTFDQDGIRPLSPVPDIFLMVVHESMTGIFVKQGLEYCAQLCRWLLHKVHAFRLLIKISKCEKRKKRLFIGVKWNINMSNHWSKHILLFAYKDTYLSEKFIFETILSNRQANFVLIWLLPVSTPIWIPYDKWLIIIIINYLLYSLGWNYLTIPKLEIWERINKFGIWLLIYVGIKVNLINKTSLMFPLCLYIVKQF